MMRTLQLIPELGDLWFENGWFVQLGPLLAREVIGDRYKPRREGSEPGQPGTRQWVVPVWWIDRRKDG